MNSTAVQYAGALRHAGCLTNHTKTFLDGFFECTADSHHFADRLHA